MSNYRYIRYINAIRLFLEIKKKEDDESKSQTVKSLYVQQEQSNDLSIRIKSMEGIGQGFLQLILQLHFVSILWVLGGGSLLYASEKDDFYYYKGKATLLYLTLALSKLLSNRVKSILYQIYHFIF